MILENIFVGLVQLVFAIVFAVLALYIGFSVLSRITRGYRRRGRTCKR